MCGLLLDGFNRKEAQRDAVVVQELPDSKRPLYEKLWGKPYKSYADYNIEHTRCVEELCSAFTSVATFAYGGLSHCTLVLGLLCLKNGAVW